MRARLALLLGLLVAGAAAAWWLPGPAPFSLGVPDPFTGEERAWLRQHPVLRLAPDPNFPPIEYFDEDGRYRGLVADYHRLIEARMGVRFEVVRAATWEEVLEKARRREVDIVGEAQITPSREEYLIFSQSILDLPNVIIANDGSTGSLDFARLAGKKVALTRGNALDEYVRRDFPQVQVVPVSDDLAGLREVSFGRVDATVVNLAIASWLIDRHGFTNLRVAGDSGRPNPLSIASRKDWPILARILSKALAAIPAEERNAISRRWIKLDRTYLERGAWIAFLGAAALAALIILAVLLINRALRRQVETRTLALRESEEKFRLLIEKALAGMYVIREGCFIYANPRLEEILGYGPGELVGVRPDALMLPEDLPKMSASWEELKAGVPATSYSVRARRKDGAIVDLGIRALAVNFEGVLSAIGMAQDIGERSRAQAEIKEYIARLERTAEGTLQAVASMVEQRDPYTAGHERRVGELAAAIGTEMGLPEDTVKGLRLTGYVHDVGKISVPAEILAKPTRLTPIEFELIKNHSRSGYDILKKVDFSWPLAEVVLQHHERLDGSGYPRKLQGEQIVLEARVMAVADVVEAMSSHRPYRPGQGIEAALAEVERNSGKLYDPRVVAACLRLFRNKGYAFPA